MTNDSPTGSKDHQIVIPQAGVVPLRLPSPPQAVDLELLEGILLLRYLTKPSKPGEIVISYDAFFLLSNTVTGLRNLEAIQQFPLKPERGLSSTREGGTYRRLLWGHT